MTETPFTQCNRLSKQLYNRFEPWLYNGFDNRLYRKQTSNPQPVECLYTRYSRLSQPVVKPRCTTGLTTVLKEQPLFIQPVVKPGCVHSTGCQTALYNPFDNRLYTRYSRLSNRLSNGFDNRLSVCIHDTSCIQTFNLLSNPFDNRLYRVNGA